MCSLAARLGIPNPCDYGLMGVGLPESRWSGNSCPATRLKAEYGDHDRHHAEHEEDRIGQEPDPLDRLMNFSTTTHRRPFSYANLDPQLWFFQARYAVYARGGIMNNK